MAKRFCISKFLIEEPIRLYLRSYPQKMPREQREFFEKEKIPRIPQVESRSS